MDNFCKKAKHYIKLTRFTKPTGAWLLFLPCLWSVLMMSKSITDLLWIPVFFVGAFAMRSAGCIINDIIDKNIDSQVKRTSSRPLASGVLNYKDALLPLLACLSIGLCILLIIGSNAVGIGLFFLLLVFIYPFAKRFFQYPQVILAIIFNSGALFASIAITSHITIESVFLYLGAFFWIVYYDTIYAHQDKIYDKELGLYSMSLTKFGTKKWLKFYYVLATSFWLFAGVFSGLNILYFVVVSLLFWVFHKQLKSVNLEYPESCMNAFIFNQNVGFILSLAIAVGRI